MLINLRRFALFSKLLSSTIACLLSCTLFADSSPLKLLDDEWLEVKTESFHIITDADENYAKAFAHDLEAFRRFAQMFINSKNIEGVNRYKIFVIKKAAHFRRIDIGSNRYQAAFTFSRHDGNFSVVKASDFKTKKKENNSARQTLFGVYVNFLLRNTGNTTNYPLWYRGGLNSFLSATVIDSNIIKYGMRTERYLWTVNRLRVIPIEEIFKATQHPKKIAKRSEFHASSWALQHYFFANPNYQKKVIKYLSLWNKGVDIDKAFQAAFEMSYSDLGRLVKKHTKKRQYTYLTYEPEKPAVNDFHSIRKLPDSEIAFHLGQVMWLRHKSGRDEASVLLRKSIELDPSSPTSQSYALRHLWLKTKETDEIIQQLGVIYPDHKDDPWLNALYGDLLFGKAWDTNGEESTKLLKQARSKFRKALRADSAHLRAWEGLAQVYRKDPSLLSEGKGMQEASTALQELAYRFGDMKYYFELAKMYEQQQQTEPAKNLYRHLAASRNAFTKKAKQSLSKLLENEKTAEAAN
ncbi:hypothetical protein KFE80_10430 [bacterium SCSIO 12696]|nr:hypothetical protein KFE80_10430 [bacterium SCSIO 12696]